MIIPAYQPLDCGLDLMFTIPSRYEISTTVCMGITCRNARRPCTKNENAKNS